MSVVMQAPVGVPGATCSSGNSYTANYLGQITADNKDVGFLIGAGWVAVGGLANFIAAPRNLIDGGDFSVNPFQRNIAGLASGGIISSAISNTLTYFADRFFVVGASTASILAAVVADTSVSGFSQDLKISRSNTTTDTNAIKFGQVLDTAKSLVAQSQQVTLSFYAKAGANYSGGPLSALVMSGTGTNQSASAMAVSSSWTGQASPVVGSQTLTTTMSRYSFTGLISAAATQLGVQFSWTPSGTAGGTDDAVYINGVQLEVGGLSVFEHLHPALVAQACQRFAFVIPEPASGAAITAGMNTSSSAQLFEIDPPVPMFKTPTVTVAAGTFKTNQAGTATATTISAASAQTTGAIGILGSSTGTAGQATLLQGGGGSGWILASADF